MTFYIGWATPDGPGPGAQPSLEPYVLDLNFGSIASGTFYPSYAVLGLGSGASPVATTSWVPVGGGSSIDDYGPIHYPNSDGLTAQGWAYVFTFPGINLYNFGTLTIDVAEGVTPSDNKLYIRCEDAGGGDKRLVYYTDYVGSGPAVLVPWWTNYTLTSESL